MRSDNISSSIINQLLLLNTLKPCPMHFEKYSEIETNYLENKENEYDNKENNNLNGSKLKIKLSKTERLFKKFSLEEGIIFKKHRKNERRELRTAYKYQDIIRSNEEVLDVPDVLKHNELFESRTEIVDWIIGIQDNLNITDDTLFLSIYIIDKIMLQYEIAKDKLKLICIAAVLIAQKYEETEWQSIEMILIAAKKHGVSRTVKKAEIIKIERFLLKVLDYNIKWSNPLYFLRSTNKTNNFSKKLGLISKYFLHVMFLTKETYKYKNRIKATTAMYITRKLLGVETNKNLFFYYANTDKEEIRECLIDAQNAIKENIQFTGLISKFTKESRMNVYEFLYKK